MRIIQAQLWRCISPILVFGFSQASAAVGEPEARLPQPVVEVEEDVYSSEPSDNGAGLTWCGGSTCLVRIGDRVFASGRETLKEFVPMNNCRWMLFSRGASGWRLEQVDQRDRTREPSPLAGFSNGRLFLSVNPTVQAAREAATGPAQPQMLEFSASAPSEPFQRLLPVWKGTPAFSEHSYRSLAADGENRELILFQNLGEAHAEWTFLNRAGTWSAQGQLQWPFGAEYDHPKPIRVCYPNVVLTNRAVYLCGVSDVLEPYERWRDFKKDLTGKEWDYDFRRLFFTWTDDITTGPFHGWLELASRDKTCGWIWPGDLWVDPDRRVHVLWSERAIDERLRAKFFPEARQSYALNYAVLRDGKVMLRRTLAEAREGGSQEIPTAGRFQLTPDGRIYVIYYVHGRDASGTSISENRILEITGDGSIRGPVRVAFKEPFTDFFTATTRGGSPPARTLDLLGLRSGNAKVMSYGRVRLE